MSESPQPDAESTDAPPPGGVGQVLKDWVLPIAIGLALGWLGITFWPKVVSAISSPTARIVDRWEYGNPELEIELEEELKAIGVSSLTELEQAYLDVPDEYPEMKLWVAHVLAREPYFDQKFLAQQAQAGKTWDQRCAAVSLVDLLGAKADPSVVAPGVLDWLNDLDLVEHGPPLGAVRYMLEKDLVAPDTAERIKAALSALADRSKRRPTGDEDVDSFIVPDRALAAFVLGEFIPDADVMQQLRALVMDETEEMQVRVDSMRILAIKSAFDDIEMWEAASKSADDVVRQTVADNGQRCKAPEFSRVLKPLQYDAHEFVRAGALDSQIARAQPTMLEDYEMFLEDWYEEVRARGMFAAARFKSNPGGERRLAQILWILEHSEEPRDVEAAILSLYHVTGKHFGFALEDLQPRLESVSETAIDAWRADKGGRDAAIGQWREQLGASSIWTDADRRRAAERLKDHADPRNRERAKELLGEK